eukprot:6183454-Pleurochrysis_carterae.AAC.4
MSWLASIAPRRHGRARALASPPSRIRLARRLSCKSVFCARASERSEEQDAGGPPRAGAPKSVSKYGK